MLSIGASPVPWPLEALQVPSSFEVRDSAGIRIVRSAFPDRTQRPVWWVSQSPEVSVGQLGGPSEYVVYRVTEVLRFSDGTLVVANAAGTELRFYDAGGNHLRTVGREGDGPGEFRSMSALRRLEDDRLLVADDRLKRVTHLERDGGVAETHRFEGANVGSALSNGMIVGRTGDNWSPREQRLGLTETTTHMVLIDGEVGRADTLVSMPGPVWWASETDGGAFRVRIVPWSPSIGYATSSDRIAVGWSGAPRVHLYDEGGDPLRIVEWSQAPSRVLSDDLEEMVLGRTEAEQPAFRRLLREMPVPDRKPLFARLLNR